MIYVTRMQKSMIAAIVLIVVIISGTVYIRQGKATEIGLGQGISANEQAEPDSIMEQARGEKAREEKVSAEPLEISVYICGCVGNPGVVRVKEGTRLDEAVGLAGGALLEADLNAVNLAYKLADEDMIYIPKKGEEHKNPGNAVLGVSTVRNVIAKKSGKVNINTAGESELDTLEGVGPATAKAIIQYRDKNGPFDTIEDIKKVKGIGIAKFNNMKDKITVD